MPVKDMPSSTNIGNKCNCFNLGLKNVFYWKNQDFSILNLFNKEEFAITDMELSAIARAAIIGFNSPIAAMGTAPVL